MRTFVVEFQLVFLQLEKVMFKFGADCIQCFDLVGDFVDFTMNETLSGKIGLGTKQSCQRRLTRLT
jgi:hypothetical protein